MNWEPITDTGRLDEIDRLSHDRPVVLFKHSTRCSISTMAKSRMERQWQVSGDSPVFYIDVISSRDVSNAIAQRYGVQHESPQILVVREGKCVYNASHDIDPGEAIGRLSA